jgi:hypothetical protein
MSTWVFGEGVPAAIPELDGQRIIILGPSLLASRSWDSNFFANIHDALRSRTTIVEVLSPEQVNGWLERIKREPR